MAANNVLATGVMEGLRGRGLRVPRDVALVAFDDLPGLAAFFPFLTVVVQPAYEMGFTAAQLLLRRINADVPIAPREVILPTRLMLRYSCGRFLNHPEATEANLALFEGRSEMRLVNPVPPELLQRLNQVSAFHHYDVSPSSANKKLSSEE